MSIRANTREYFRTKWAKTIGASALSVAIVATALTPAWAEEADGPVIDAGSAVKGVYVAAAGDPVEVLAVIDDAAERVVTGRTSSGEPVQIVIQSAPVDAQKNQLLQEEAKHATGNASLGYSEVPTGPQTGKIESARLSEASKDWNVVAAHTITTTTASFSWPAVAAFSAYIEGEVAGKSDRSGEVRLVGLHPDTEYVVTLKEDTAGMKQSVRTTTITTFADSIIKDQKRIFAPLTYQPYNTAYVHKAFIPDNRVPGGQCNFLLPGYEFGGDNRTYSTPSLETPWEDADYRTMMFVNINWDNPAPYDIIWVKNVGATPIYHNGQLKKKLYADMDEMKFQNAQASSSYAKLYFSHAASNPGCKFFDASYGGVISYGEWVEFYRSGTVAVDGYRLPAPAHEMYARFTTSSGGNVPWKLTSRRANEGFICLLGNLFCPLDFYNLSTSY